MSENSIGTKDMMNSEDRETIDETGIKQIEELQEMEGGSDMAKIVTNLHDSYKKLSMQHNQVCF